MEAVKGSASLKAMRLVESQETSSDLRLGLNNSSFSTWRRAKPEQMLIAIFKETAAPSYDAEFPTNSAWFK